MLGVSSLLKRAPYGDIWDAQEVMRCRLDALLACRKHRNPTIEAELDVNGKTIIPRGVNGAASNGCASITRALGKHLIALTWPLCTIVVTSNLTGWLDCRMGPRGNRLGPRGNERT